MPELRDLAPNAPGTPYRVWQLRHGHKPVTREETAAWLRRIALEAEEDAKKYGRRTRAQV